MRARVRLLLALAVVLGGPPEAGATSTARERGQRLAAGRLLVASRRLVDPNFAETVILVVAHGPAGAMGLVVNRPTRVPLSVLLPDVEELRGRSDTVFAGGPVDVGRVFLLVRSREPPPGATRVFGDTYASGSVQDLRRALGESQSASRFHVYVGYAGWGAGQLEAEVARGDWHVAPADAETVFEREPSRVWTDAVARWEGQWTRTPGPPRRPAGYAVAAVRALHLRNAGGARLAEFRELGHRETHGMARAYRGQEVHDDGPDPCSDTGRSDRDHRGRASRPRRRGHPLVGAAPLRRAPRQARRGRP
jgi:putative transcriptional regulator